MKTKIELQQIPEIRKYKKNYQPPPLVVSFLIDGEIVGANETFIVFSGLPKNGKTLFLDAAIASYFLKNPFFKMQLQLPKNKPKIALFDTENGEYNFYKNIANIKGFANGSFNENLFDAFRFRGDTPQNMLIYIEHYLIANPDCGCIVIDGLIDLVFNYNDPVECTVLGHFLKRITNDYKVFILGVLHTNKSGFETLGHLGAVCNRACNATLKVVKNKELGTFELSPVLLRDAKKDFETISIKYFENSGFGLTETDVPYKKRTYKEWTKQEHRALCTSVLIEKGDTYKNLVEHIKEKECVGTNAAKDILKIWIAEQIILKIPSKDNLYFYQVNT
jgi:hypothetical protein